MGFVGDSLNKLIHEQNDKILSVLRDTGVF
jgi:hypothetical protein